MGRTFWWLATEMMEKLLGDAFHGRTMCEGRSSGFEREKRGTIGDGFKRIPSETTVRENMGRTFWRLATEMIEKLLGDADSRLKKRRIVREVQLRFQ